MAGTVLFCSDTLWEARGEQLVAIDPTLEVIRLVGDERVTPGDVERIEVAFFSPDLWPRRARSFLGVTLKAPNLRWFQTMSAGTDDDYFATLRAKGVIVTNSAGAAAPTIAQTVIMYLLALSRQLPRLTQAQAARRWETASIRDLTGLKLAIVGYGAIGAELAGLARPFGIEPVGLRRTPATGDEPCPLVTPDRLDELMAWADAVVVTAPHTPATRGMIGERQLGLMRQGSWFVNVGRGAVVDERALTDALVSGRLGGAALDVFETEPLPVASPLWTMPNVIVTPHMSANSASTDARAVEVFVDNFTRWSRRQPLVNVTDD